MVPLIKCCKLAQGKDEQSLFLLGCRVKRWGVAATGQDRQLFWKEIGVVRIRAILSPKSFFENGLWINWMSLSNTP